ncbi:MAG TPA: radical SAM protein [Deltaproteobacteria bacterium]|nr:radical SAM protein [Deltaproteobacteria bacterium]
MKQDEYKIKETRPFIIPVFIMNRGCPQSCVFCNQGISAGSYPADITREYFDFHIRNHLNSRKNQSSDVQIAFYGGNFTGLCSDYQKMLLEWANAYIDSGYVSSLRISTRPDYISRSILNTLKEYNVTTVELGAQSFVDKVLFCAQRGHTASRINEAMELLKEFSFQISLHLMAGLPEDSKEGFIYSLHKTMKAKPDMVRVNPVIVFKNTVLADFFRQGKYTPLGISEAVDLCALAYEILNPAGVRIIRFGLHLSDEMKQEGAVLAGPIHESFGSLVLSAIYLKRTIALLADVKPVTGKIRFLLSPHDISNFTGFRKSNIETIHKVYPSVNFVVESSLSQHRGNISVYSGNYEIISANLSGIA